MKANAPSSLAEFFAVLNRRVDAAVEGAAFDPSQRALLLATTAKIKRNAARNPLSEPLSLFYLVALANGRRLDEQGEELALFLQFYLLSAALADDVQDDDLAGTPYAEVGPPIAINSSFAFLFLGLDALRRAMEREADPARRMQYLRLFNESSLRAVAGQHCDLLGANSASTPAQVLANHQSKTSTPSLLCQAAAIFAGCSDLDCGRYRRVGENLALLAQLVDDVRDMYGKQVSPDLMTGKMTYPLACFLESAAPAQRQSFERLKAGLPGSLPAIRQLLYGAGAIRQVATTIEGFRRNIHRELAATENLAPAHRTFLFIVDGLAQLIYPTPALPETKPLFEPSTPWHRRVRELARNCLASMESLGAPPVPPLVPWHLPHWMYEPERGVVFYPDIEGQPEETLRFQAELLGLTDLDRVRDVAEQQAPAVIAHELFHYWRDATKNLTRDMWREEYIANSLALSYCQAFEPGTLARVIRLSEEVLARPENELAEAGVRTLEGLFSEQSGTLRATYGMSLHQMALVQLAMVRRLAEDVLPLSSAVERYLTTCDEKAA